MFVTDLRLNGYKNLRDIAMQPDPSFNLIVGRNAQGKTNLLEAIWIMTGCRSFRGAKERDYIGFEQSLLQMQLKFQDVRREQEIHYAMQRGELREKKLQLNGVAVKSTSRLFEQFKCVVFTPDDRILIKGNPERRRSFVDLCYSQIKPKYLDYIRKFNLLVGQRNAVLRGILSRQSSRDALRVWDEQLAAVGAYISFCRHAYVEKLAACCGELYGSITAGQEALTIEYQSSVFPDYAYPVHPDAAMTAQYLQKLQDSMEDDIRLGYTASGAGRDDILLKINGRSVREYGSQGQQKSTALVLKLAQADIYYADLRESPVILLDDVMGELDQSRQRFVYEIVKDMQVFITTCNEEAVLGHERGKRFTVEDGRIVS